MGFIVEIIVYFFVEIIFEVFIMGVFRSIHWLGLFTLKIITLNDGSLTEMKVQYKGSSKPWFWGIALISLTIYLALRLGG